MKELVNLTEAIKAIGSCDSVIELEQAKFEEIKTSISKLFGKLNSIEMKYPIITAQGFEHEHFSIQFRGVHVHFKVKQESKTTSPLDKENEKL